jgi:hypothetical protein
MCKLTSLARKDQGGTHALDARLHRFARDACGMLPFRASQSQLETLERTNGGPDCAVNGVGDDMCDDD